MHGAAPRWNPPPFIFDPRRRWPSREFMTRRIKNKGAHMLSMKDFFQIIVRAALAAALISINCFGQSLKSLVLNPVTRRTQSDRHQNREHQRERQRRPERQKDLEKETFHKEIGSSGHRRSKIKSC